MQRAFAVLFCLTAGIACGANIITVDDDGPADYTTIQAAIDASGNGDIVVVCLGTYTGLGNRDISFAGKAITVRSTDPQDPAVVAATVIDCENLGRGFLFNNSESPDSIVNGFTIINAEDTFTLEVGGAIRCDSSSPTVANCRILNSLGYVGGGICNENGSSPTLINCIISGNMGTDSGGGISNSDESDPNIVNCTFTGNSSWIGGAIYNDYCSNPTVTNCTFSGNVAGFAGGGIFHNGSESEMAASNCILWGNAPDEIYVQTGTVIANYSDVQGGYAGTGNIEVDPMFIEPGYWDDSGTPSDPWDDFWVDGDYRLLASSPCIDAGDSAAVGIDTGDIDDDGSKTEQMPWDLDGNLRFLDDPDTTDTGVTDGPIPIVDMGAYESSGLAMVGDFEPDGDVDLDDLGVIVAWWLQIECGECGGGDLSGDGNINLADFAVFAKTGLVGGGGQSHKPILAPIGDKSILEEQNLNFTVGATDPDGDSLTYLALNLPSGAVFDPPSQVFDWTPATGQTGQYFVTILVFDGIEVDSETVAITVSPEPVGYWAMDDNADNTTVSDSSSNGNDGAAQQNTEDLSTAGIIDSALTFNGSSDYIDLGEGGLLDDLPANDFTVSVWVYDESTADRGVIIGVFPDGTAGWMLRKQGTGSARYLDFWAGHATTNAHFMTSEGSLAPDSWRHVAAVWYADTKTCKIYIDGVESSYVTNDAGAGNYNSDVSFDKEIGRMALSGGIQFFDGSIDDVKIFETALSEARILQLATEF